MRIPSVLITCFVLFIVAIILPSHAMGETRLEGLNRESVAESWSWAKEEGAIKNPKNVGKARKLRKKGLAAATPKQMQQWAVLGEGFCALAGVDVCSRGTDIFESSLKDSSNKTVQAIQKESR